MPHSRRRDDQRRSTPGTAPDARSGDRAPDKRRRGGQELPDDLQDRPEQNAGYDEAVRKGAPGSPSDDLIVDVLPGENGRELAVHEVVEPDVSDDPDSRAERDAIKDVRRRERKTR